MRFDSGCADSAEWGKASGSRRSNTAMRWWASILTGRMPWRPQGHRRRVDHRHGGRHDRGTLDRRRGNHNALAGAGPGPGGGVRARDPDGAGAVAFGAPAPRRRPPAGLGDGRVRRVDPQGVGRDISVARQADYLVAWLDAIGVERAVLVGHDLGGGVVQIAAVRSPSRCAGPVLRSGTGPRPRSGSPRSVATWPPVTW